MNLHHLPSRISEYSRVVQPNETLRVSVAADGTLANQRSYSVSISANSRYITYTSRADNLVPGDNNHSPDVFLYDRLTDNTTLVSVNSDGKQGNSGSTSSYVSRDGRYVNYYSGATNLVPGDTNGQKDVFLYDTLNKKTTRVNLSNNGEQANGLSNYTTISANGRYVTYVSEATNLVPGDSNGQKDIFLYDTLTKKTSRINVSDSGEQANGKSSEPTISRDGRYIAYYSFASNLVSGDTNNTADIFLYDNSTKKTIRVNVNDNGQQANKYGDSPSISGDGRYIAFESDATNLVPGDTNGKRDIIVRDTLAKKTFRASISSDGAQGNGASYTVCVSDNGRYISFESAATNLVDGDSNGVWDVFVYDNLTQKTSRVSLTNSGKQANGLSYSSSISSDGSYIAYNSEATNLTGSDTNGWADIFLTRLSSDQPTKGSVLSFSQDNFTVKENGWYFQPVTITRTGGTIGAVSVLVTPNSGTARANQDYSNLPLRVSFASGETKKTLIIPISDDGIVEPSETINLTLSNPSNGATLGQQKTSVLTISDNDTRNGVIQTGTPGNDLLSSGSTGNDTLKGIGGNDTIFGSDGNDLITGGSGNDYLTGGRGNDIFLYNSPQEKLDKIADFNPNNDTIQVKSTGFLGGLKAGFPITSNQLIKGNIATSPSHRFIYNKGNGDLLFDRDGSGAIASVPLATLSPNLNLTNLDIFVI